MSKIAAFLIVGLAASALALEIKPVPVKDVDAKAPPAFAEAQSASRTFKLPRGLQINVFAAEPQLISPVCFTLDEKGRVYVVETFKAWGNGGIDMREYMPWLDDDLAARTVADRVAWITRRAGQSAQYLTLDSDRVRLIEDTDRDGRADKATIFTDGYHEVADGVAAGLLARKGEVYFANIPRLYKLKDASGAGKADQKSTLFEGFGIHYQLIGHDLHGLIMGPDGRLYFSIGDRGAAVRTREGKLLNNPDSGVVFRCDPDGANLEMFATGLRNPQELAFDQYGNLFTGDNNCDAGDSGRWVYVVEGGETGWRMGYQFIREPHNAGPWMNENLWRVESEHPAAWCLPPIGYSCPGPSGLAYYPGVGLGDQYRNHFFLCDFRGSTNSGVWTFEMKPRGAGFEIASRRQFLWNLLPTDVEFGPDGAMYVSDWVNGWFRPMKGRIWRVVNPQSAQDARVAQSLKLIEEGMSGKPEAELLGLLEHAHQRIRLEAQYELAARGDKSISGLHQRLSDDQPQLARIHAVWALGQIARKSPPALDPVVKLLDDGDSEIRAQAARALGDARHAGAAAGLLKHLKDETARVRYFAAMGLGKLQHKPALPRLLDFLRDNTDRDVYLRHAGVMALLWMNDRSAIETAGKDASHSVRLAAVLAMRRLQDPSIARFLDDPHALIGDEAARAINDELIEAAIPALAARLQAPGLTHAVWFRAINAHYRLGGPDNAAAVARFAADRAAPEEGRIEALHQLAEWTAPSGRDRVMGLWRPLAPRDAAIATGAAGPKIELLLADPSPRIRIATISLIEQLRIGGGALAPIALDAAQTPETRAAALKAMEALKDARLAEAVKVGAEQGAGPLRRQAIGALTRMPDAAGKLSELFKSGSPQDRKSILEALATSSSRSGEPILIQLLKNLTEGTLPPPLQLDLLEAAGRSKNPDIAALLKRFESQRNASDPLGDYTETLEGGDAAAGRKIFFEKAETSCVRCHKIGGDQEVVGPDLKGIALKKDRRYLLESIVRPNAQIAPGFSNVILKLKGNMTVGGLLKGETADEISIAGDNDEVETYDKAQVLSRTQGLSAMPEGLTKDLTKRELRDLVEFLAGLNNDATLTAEGKESEGHGK